MPCLHWTPIGSDPLILAEGRSTSVHSDLFLTSWYLFLECFTSIQFTKHVEFNVFRSDLFRTLLTMQLFKCVPSIRAIHDAVQLQKFAAYGSLFTFIVDRPRGLSARWFITCEISTDEAFPTPYKHILLIT